MIDTMAARLATGIKNVVPHHPASFAVLKFSLSVLLNVVFIVGITLIVSLFTGRITAAGLILVSFALLRQVSGGVHLKSGTACVLLTTTLFTLLSYVNVSVGYVQVMNVVSLVLVLMFAPIGIERQTRIPKRLYPLLKVIAALLVVTNMVVCSPAVAVSFVVQALTLLIARTRKEVKTS